VLTLTSFRNSPSRMPSRSLGSS